MLDRSFVGEEINGTLEEVVVEGLYNGDAVVGLGATVVEGDEVRVFESGRTGIWRRI